MPASALTIIYFVVIIALFYLMLFLPERKRKKSYANMLSNLKVNDEIVTKGGIIGKIVNLQPDFVIIQTGPDKVKIKFSKDGIASVINQKTTESK
ncbi:MAG: preprotein translocase subunit YajC [Bacillota bacterium]|nr:preprotein translocase subunit YajC [Bacillota bacterium]